MLSRTALSLIPDCLFASNRPNVATSNHENKVGNRRKNQRQRDENDTLFYEPGDVNLSEYSTINLSRHMSAIGPNRTTGRTYPAAKQVC